MPEAPWKLADWITAARNELPKLRGSLRESEAGRYAERPAVLRTDIELIQAVLRTYTVLEHSELAGSIAVLPLLESVHRGIEQYATNPARRDKGLRLHHCSEALADLARRIESVGNLDMK